MIPKHSTKITISFVTVLGLSIVMLNFDLSRMEIMHSKLESITKEHNSKTDLMTMMQHGIYERQVSLRNIILLTDPFERDIGKTKFNSHALNVIEARNTFATMNLNDEEKNLLKKINIAMILAYQAQISLIDRSIYDAEHVITKEEVLTTFNAQAVFMNNVKQMIQLQKNSTQMAYMDAENSYNEAKTSVYILGGSSLLFGIFIAVYIIRLTESQRLKVSRAMSELEKSHESLEQGVTERTEQLAKAMDAALASNKAKDNFLATMSHELRTPLNIIIGYSEMIEEMAEEEGNRKLLPDIKKIQSAANHQLILVSSILDISKIEEGKLDIHAIDFDVEKLISELDASARPLMAKNNNMFSINCMHGIGMMYSDNLRIKQILLNLLSNAAKFTQQGQISLHVTKDKENDNIKFVVSDNGIGISEEYMDDLFKKFTQADSSTTRQYGGSGLGLSISKQLSQHLKGDLTADSIKGKGANFTLCLPTIYIETT